MFNGADHVALATGVTDAAGTHVYSFWPPPDTAFAAVDYKKPGKGKGLAAGTPDKRQGHDDRGAGRGDGLKKPPPWSRSGRRRGSHGAARDDPVGAGRTAAPPPGPRAALEHGLGERRPAAPAASRVRTLSGGAVCVLSVAEEGERPPRRGARRGGRAPPRARVGGAGDRQAGLGDRRLPRRGRRQLDGAGAGPRTARPRPGARRRAGRDDAVARGGDGRLARGRCASCSRGRCSA